MTEVSSAKESPSSEMNKIILKEEIIKTTKSQPPNLDAVNNPQMKEVISDAVDLMLKLQEIASAPHHPKIHADTDVVLLMTGPGHFSKKFPDKDDRYKDLEWTRKMDRFRLRTSAAIVREITAKRLNKPASQLTDQDIIENGPFLVYAGTPAEGKHLREVYKIHKEDYKLIPLEKLIICDKVKNSDGSFRDAVDTVDGVESFEVPQGINPRRIVLVSHVQHLTRILYILGNYQDKIKGAVLQPYPIKAPKRGEFEYGIMEVRGILAGIYKTGKSANKPYPTVL